MTDLKIENNWDKVIAPKSNALKINFIELWRYRDLLLLFVKRDFVSFYKQTILGPIWFVIQPIFTTITFILIFGKLAGIGTDGVPMPLFYICSVSAWTFFSECLTKTSSVFRDNSNIFGKVYFPRLIMPLSIILSTLVKFSIQIFLIFIMLIYYIFFERNIQINFNIFFLPLIVLLMALQGLGLGMIVSALTTKYRDLALLLTFGVQLLMYASPVAYPISSLHGKVKILIELNPVSFLIEGFRKSILNVGVLTFNQISYSVIITFLIFFIGIVIFNKVEKNFVDTI